MLSMSGLPSRSASRNSKTKKKGTSSSATSDAIEGLRKELSQTTLNTQAIYEKHMKSPKRRNSLGSNSRSYLSKRRSNTNTDKRRSKIRDSMLSGVDSVLLGDSSSSDIMSFKEEDSYLKRLLKNEKTFQDIDRPKAVRRRIHHQQQKKQSNHQQPRIRSNGKTITKNVSHNNNKQKQKSLSMESTASTATSKSTTSATFDPKTYYIPQGSHCIDLEIPPSSPSASPKLRFAKTGTVAYVDEVLSESDFDLLFYTDEELSDQRHEAFLEMCGIENEEF